MKTKLRMQFDHVQQSCDKAGNGLVRLRQFVGDGPKGTNGREADLWLSARDARFLARMLLEAADKAEEYNAALREAKCNGRCQPCPHQDE